MKTKSFILLAGILGSLSCWAESTVPSLLPTDRESNLTLNRVIQEVSSLITQENPGRVVTTDISFDGPRASEKILYAAFFALNQTNLREWDSAVLSRLLGFNCPYSTPCNLASLEISQRSDRLFIRSPDRNNQTVWTWRIVSATPTRLVLESNAGEIPPQPVRIGSTDYLRFQYQPVAARVEFSLRGEGSQRSIHIVRSIPIATEHRCSDGLHIERNVATVVTILAGSEFQSSMPVTQAFLNAVQSMPHLISLVTMADSARPAETRLSENYCAMVNETDRPIVF